MKSKILQQAADELEATYKNRLTRPKPPIPAAKPSSADVPSGLARVRVSGRILGNFTRQLGIMLFAGVPLVRAMSHLSGQPESPVFGRVIDYITRDIESGRPITRSLSKFPRVFPPLYVSLARIGEINGTMAESMLGIADFLEKDEEMVRKTKAALTYPFVILAVASVIGWALFNFLVPQFIRMFEEMHMVLPALTRMLVVAVHVLQSPVAIASAIVLAVAAYHWYQHMVATAEGRFTLDALKLSIPKLNSIVKKVAVARMARSLAALTGSGLPLTQGLKLAGDACGNEVVRKVLSSAVKHVQEGESLASNFHPKRTIFEPIVYYMIHIGEETGRLDHLLTKLADYYEQEVDCILDGIASLLEPLLTMGIGLIVGIVCLGIFLPLYGLINNLG